MWIKVLFYKNKYDINNIAILVMLFFIGEKDEEKNGESN